MKITNKFKIIGFSLTFLLIILDQLFKFLAEKLLKPEGFIKFLDPILNFNWQINEGAAWGIFAGNKLILIGFTAIVLLVVCYLILFNKITDKFMVIFSCIIIAGGFGNLIDRIIQGYVIDYLQFGFFDFPVFNLADVCVTVGAIAFAIYYIFFYKSENDKIEKKKNGKLLND
ncbi:MAG: signal peptidase II [Oscillospiraceae bacterium]